MHSYYGSLLSKEHMQMGTGAEPSGMVLQRQVHLGRPPRAREGTPVANIKVI